MPLVPLFPEDLPDSDRPKLVRYRQVLALELRARIGWLANIVDKVLGLYSDYFRRESLADEIIAFAWRFAESGEGSVEEAEELELRLELRYFAEEILENGLITDAEVRRIRGSSGPLITDQEQEFKNHYFDALRLLGHLIVERIDSYGKDAVLCVELAGSVLTDRLHWAARTKAGLGNLDLYSQRVVAALYRYAHATLPIAAAAVPRRGLFDSHPLVLPRPTENLPPCSEDTIPPHERGELILPPGVVWETT
jgi:hypothetical protein